MKEVPGLYAALSSRPPISGANNVRRVMSAVRCAERSKPVEQDCKLVAQVLRRQQGVSEAGGRKDAVGGRWRRRCEMCS